MIAFLKDNLKIAFLFALILGSIFYSLTVWIINSQKSAIHIAVVGPMSGDSEANGKAYVNGISLFLNSFNNSGGLNGRKVVIDVYDDQNNSELAKEKASEIITKGEAIAVIGHNSSACSRAGGPLYRDNGIPAITPASTNVEVTKGNDWYFRVIFNDNSQGRFLANYIKKILKKDRIKIIHEDDVYGGYLADVFQKTAREIGLYVSVVKSFKVKDVDKVEEMKKVAQSLKVYNDNELIFLAMGGANGALFLPILRDSGIKNPLVAPDSFASSGFLKAMSGLKREVDNPGYYSDGLHVTTPLIFDNANQKAQNFRDLYLKTYASEPDWRAVYAYDSIMILLEAIKRNNLSGEKESITEDRIKIRDFLASLDTPAEGLEGATGLNYFENGDSPKPVSIGIYKNKNIISALTQLQVVRDPNEISDLKSALSEERVLFIDNKYLYKTNVVYTGIEINEITDLKVIDLTYNLDFYIWFRYSGNFNPEFIEFQNSVTPIELKEPIEFNTNPQSGMSYKIFKLSGNFRANSLPVKYVLEQHALGVSFHHKVLNRNNLIYVIDTIGMGQNSKTKNDSVRLSRVLSPSSGWMIASDWFFQDTMTKNSLGSPRYINMRDPTIELSRFNMGVRIKKDELTLRRFLPGSLSMIVLIISLSGVILLGIFSSLRSYKQFGDSIWLGQTLLIYVFLVASEVEFIDRFIERENITMVKVILSSYDLFWWIIPSMSVTQSIERFLWTPLEKKTDHKIPTVVRKFLNFIIYLLTFFGIVAFVYDQKITSLLATSGMVAMIIGLAIQVNIANVFSGIAINIERPFRVGDWVKIGSSDEAKVVDITWRTTRLQNRSGIIVSIPNSIASESVITNYSLPDNIVELWFTIHIDPKTPPRRVVKVLMDALMSSDGVLRSPAPYARFNEFSDWSADYLFGYCFKDYSKKNAVRRSVWQNIWIHLHRAGIAPAFQKQEIHYYRGEPNNIEDAKSPLALIREVDIFESFNEQEMLDLSNKITPLEFQPGEMIVKAGDQQFTMYVISEGVVNIQVKLENGNFLEVARLGAGNFFGEMSMLTGAVRTANVVADSYTKVYEISKDDVNPFLEKHPEIYRYVQKVMSQRSENSQSKKQEAMFVPPPQKESILQRLKKKSFALLGLQTELEEENKK
ncbi:MAG: ABC transporter substrate-binding protein [Leptospiraceae bacterium]|nr:ABC transporter substrate-binding protein [Leptospiraceae bacterium]MCP5513309.1 ABC transporter substrate-binding protein [Leptospiraceae bacterium]